MAKSGARSRDPYPKWQMKCCPTSRISFQSETIQSEEPGLKCELTKFEGCMAIRHSNSLPKFYRIEDFCTTGGGGWGVGVREGRVNLNGVIRGTFKLYN